MSSYDPPEEAEDGSSYDPGVMEKEISEQREFSDVLVEFDKFEYVLFGLVLSIPAAILTGFLLAILFPGSHETLGEMVRWVGARDVDLTLGRR